MRIKNVRVFCPEEGFASRDLLIAGDRFAMESEGPAVDGKGCYAIPGLVDIHFHGCAGADFSTADLPEMEKMAAYQAQNGVTAICPATMTLPEEALARACRSMAALGAPEKGAELVGINLEGPFLSPQKPGAQNPAHLRTPDEAFFRRLQQAAGGLIRLLDLAPELEGALALIGALKGEVTCSLAHTAASYELAREAFERGARHVTHLYNAMPPFSHREPGVVGAAFDCPEVMVELICDGVHLHPAAVRATFRMFGPERIVLVSDSMMATGLGDGVYSLGGQPVEVAGKTARLRGGGAIAGSVTNLMGCLRQAVAMGIPLADAVRCATHNPARAIGVERERGGIAPGKIADLVLLDDRLNIRQVFLRGEPLL